MMPVSGVNTGAVRPLTAAEEMLGISKAQEPEQEAQGRPLRPVMDEYVPEEKQEPSGRYWIGRDEIGQPKICFDNLERTAASPEKPEIASDAKKPDQDQGAKGLGKKGQKEEICVCNTGTADHEIEQLKKKRQELEQRISTETDEARIKDLERQLAQVERELNEKDNDTYRKQHSTFTRLA